MPEREDQHEHRLAGLPGNGDDHEPEPVAHCAVFALFKLKRV